MPEGCLGEFIIIDRFVYKNVANKEWHCTMTDSCRCPARFNLSDDNVIKVKKVIRHNHDAIFQGDLDRCSIEIAEIRLESSAKNCKDEMYSMRNGKQENSAGQDSESDKLLDEGNYSKKEGSRTGYRKQMKSSDSDSVDSIDPDFPRNHTGFRPTAMKSSRYKEETARLSMMRKLRKM